MFKEVGPEVVESVVLQNQGDMSQSVNNLLEITKQSEIEQEKNKILSTLGNSIPLILIIN